MNKITLAVKIDRDSMQRALTYLASLDVNGSVEEIEKLRLAYNEQRIKTPGSGLMHDITALFTAVEELLPNGVSLDEYTKNPDFTFIGIKDKTRL